jgi:hypothetical protein
MACGETIAQRHLRLAHPNSREDAMSDKTKSTHESPGGQKERVEDDGVVNDSLGTVDPADSTGTDESKETGDAKKNNSNTRED